MENINSNPSLSSIMPDLEQSKEKYVLYGASFNPPHIGHFSAISQMLEEYDKVIVFPYPLKYKNGEIEQLPPLRERMKMLQIFLGEFFPKMHDRLILNNLSQELKIKDKYHDGIIHTYDYLKFVEENINPNSSLSLCVGLDSYQKLKNNLFYKQEEIYKNYGVFTIKEESIVQSKELRNFFINHRIIRSLKDELYIRNSVGNQLAEYIFKNNLYGVTKNSTQLKTKSKP